VLASLYQKHKEDCMFESLLELKQSRDELFQENVKLKMKIGMLENELSESVKRNSPPIQNSSRVPTTFLSKSRRRREKSLKKICSDSTMESQILNAYEQTS
jgi:hypothetical protein